MQAVAPGERATWTITVHNPADAPGSIRLEASDEVAAWAWITPAELSVPAGGEATARLSLKLPPPPSPRAGRLPFTVAARPAAGASPSAPATATAAVDVLPRIAVTASLGHAGGKGWAYSLTIRNQGNAETTVALNVEGDGSVRASVEPDTVVVPAGEAATASVSAKGRGGSFRVRLAPRGADEVVVTGSVAGAAGLRRALRWPVLVPIAAVVVLIAAVLVARGGGSSSPSTNVESVATTTPANCPGRNHLSADANGLQRPGVIVPTRYSFLQEMPGGCLPVRFNPCDPIHYVVNSKLAPAGALADLAAAFDQLSKATGMTFVNDGPTDEPAAINRAAYQPQRYGDRWAPVLIVWDHGAPYRMATDNPGGGRAIQVGNVYVSGILILNIDAVADPVTKAPIPFGFGDGATWGRVMIHELGHMVGLGHVNSPQEIMFNDLGPQTGTAQYHGGDLEGLQYLGTQAGCLQVPPHA